MSDVLQRAIEMFRSGDRQEARKLVISFVKENPQSEPGWKWMYNVSHTSGERIYCLQQILKINPGNRKAKRLLAHILEPGPRTQDIKHRKNRTKLLAFGASGAFLALSFCVVLAAFSTQFISYNNLAGNNCFFPWNGKQLCDSPQEEIRAAGNPAFAAPHASPTAIVVFAPLPTNTPTISVPSSSTPTFTAPAPPTTQATFAPTGSLPPFSDTRLAAGHWRKWPIVPELSPHAQQILREAANNPSLDPHTFSKVGDCQMVAGIFLAGYANGTYSMPDGMDETVQWFDESMLTDNLTAVNGFGINTVLDPSFGLPAGYNQCLSNETPLDCELRTRRPMLVMIGMGTNWIPNAEASFERYLRQIVDRVLETGALPILATKADNVEGDWKLNAVIAEVAYDYDLPLVNVWLSVQDLPNHGLEKPPRQVYLTGDGWMKRNHAWLVTLDKVRKILAE